MFALGPFIGLLAYVLGLLIIILCIIAATIVIKLEQLEKSK